MIGATASFFALSQVMVIARLLDRGISSTTSLGWDDLLIAISAVGRFVNIWNLSDLLLSCLASASTYPSSWVASMGLAETFGLFHQTTLPPVFT